MRTNKEIKKYFSILSEDYPYFIDKYIQTTEMQRLDGIGFFCGCDYTKLYSCKYWYTRLDHSIVTALMAWHFTKNKEQTLSALFHDLGTPAFSHCIDVMLGDAINQESAEKNAKDIIESSKEIMECLKNDNIAIEKVTKLEKYPIVENQKPKLCVDRLDGVLHTSLILLCFWNIEEIEKIYSNIVVLINENNEPEIGFKNIKVAELFYEGVYKYSVEFQTNKVKFTLQFIADCVKNLIDNSKLKLEDLYKLSEKEIIAIIKKDNYLKNDWKIFQNASNLTHTNKISNLKHCISKIKSKKRYVVPLVEVDGKTIRLDKVSNKCKKLLEAYLNYEDNEY